MSDINKERQIGKLAIQLIEKPSHEKLYSHTSIREDLVLTQVAELLRKPELKYKNIGIIDCGGGEALLAHLIKKVFFKDRTKENLLFYYR